MRTQRLEITHTVRLSKRLDADLDRCARQLDCRRADVIREALSEYCDSVLCVAKEAPRG